jgi:hypothetical protein
MVKKPIAEINYRARQNRKKRNKLGETERIQKKIKKKKLVLVCYNKNKKTKK